MTKSSSNNKSLQGFQTWPTITIVLTRPDDHYLSLNVFNIVIKVCLFKAVGFNFVRDKAN